MKLGLEDRSYGLKNEDTFGLGLIQEGNIKQRSSAHLRAL